MWLLHGFATFLRFFITDDKTAHKRTDPLNFVYGGARKSELLAYKLLFT